MPGVAIWLAALGLSTPIRADRDKDASAALRSVASVGAGLLGAVAAQALPLKAAVAARTRG